jgi:hypothetical protein
MCPPEVRFSYLIPSVKLELVMSRFGGNQDGEPREDFIDELLEFSDDYQSNDFPNIDREGCPAEDVLRKAAYSGRLIDETMREHLLTCSPCFTEFKSLRDVSGTNRIPKVMVAGIGAFTVIALTAIAFLVFNAFTSEEGAEISRSDTRSSSDSSQTKSAPSPEQDSKDTVSKVKDTPKNIRTFNFDIASNNVVRGGADRLERKMLPAEKVRILVKLSDGSPSGIYIVSLLDEFGRSLSSEIKTRSTGVTLATDLDLSQLGGPARLCIAAGDEIPDCFSVLIK